MSEPDIFEIAIGLRSLHANVKLLRGADFERDVAQLKPFLEALAKLSHKGNLYAAAIHAAKDCPVEMQRSLILAVAVELKLREVSAVMAEGQS